MTEHSSKELKLKEKQEVATPAEQTQSGVVFAPNVDIFETAQNIIVLADLPGVTPEDLKIDLRDSVLTISGEVVSQVGENERPLLIEYGMGRYFRQFTLSEVVDQHKINAQLNNGVLRLTLPKVEKATPRSIAVQAG